MSPAATRLLEKHQRNKPKKQYANFAEYCVKVQCLECRGCGYVCKEEDRDVIEGYKLAPRYKCPSCQGRGVMGRPELKKHYNEYTDKYDQELFQWQETLKLLKTAFKLLSDEQLTAILDAQHARF